MTIHTVPQPLAGDALFDGGRGDFEQFEMDEAAGDVDRNFVAGGQAEQRVADGRKDGNAVVGQVGVVGAEQVIDGLFLGLQVAQRDHSAEPGLVAGNLGAINGL